MGMKCIIMNLLIIMMSTTRLSTSQKKHPIPRTHSDCVCVCVCQCMKLLLCVHKFTCECVCKSYYSVYVYMFQCALHVVILRLSNSMHTILNLISRMEKKKFQF